MPIAIILGASYSIDALTIGIIGIFIAYVLKLNNENKETITFRQFLILLGLMRSEVHKSEIQSHSGTIVNS